MDDLRAICVQHTVFLRREAIEAGYDDRVLQRACRDAVIHRVRQGAYVFMDDWRDLTPEGRHLVTCAAVVRTAKATSVLSHVSAVVAYGMPVWDLPLHEVHLTRLDRLAGRSEAGVRQHRGRIAASDTRTHQGFAVTSPARTALDLTTLVDVEHSLPVLSEMIRATLVTEPELLAELEGKHRVPHTLTSRIAVKLADGRLESVGECRCYYMFFRHGVPLPEPQYEVYDRWGMLLGRVDFAWPELGVFVEFDGKQKYVKYLKDGETVVDAVLREKKREKQICRATGWECLRVTWADLYHPERVCAELMQMLGLKAA